MKDSDSGSLPEEGKGEASRNPGQNQQNPSFFMQQELDLLRKTAHAGILHGPMGKVGEGLGKMHQGVLTPHQAQESAAGAGMGSPQSLGDDLR